MTKSEQVTVAQDIIMLTKQQQNTIKKAAKILEETFKTYDISFCNPDYVKTYLSSRFVALQREEFHIMLLNNKLNLIETVCLSTGTLDAATVYPRELIKLVLQYNAAAVILAHNHPSGVSDPSRGDEVTTDKIIKALQAIDVRVLDHIIVAKSCYSFAEHGLI